MATKNADLDKQAHSTAGTVIAANKVEGTNVYNLTGTKLGTVDHVMIDKMSGKVWTPEWTQRVDQYCHL